MNDKPIHFYNDPEQIHLKLKELKELDLSKETFESVSERIDKTIGFIPTEAICLKKGTEVFRARKNPIFNDYKFSTLKEISIRDAEAITAFGRANLPKQAVFYCSLDAQTAAREATQWHLDDLGALISKGVDIGNYHPFTQFITISKWVLTRDIYFVNTFKDEEILGGDVSTDGIYNHLLTRYYIEKEKFNISNRLVMEFFNSEFAKTTINNQQDYYYSAYYSNLIYKQSKVGFICGLIYLSIAFDLEGYNLAIPEHNLKNLEFVSADFCYTYNSNGRPGFENQKIVVGPSFRATRQIDDSLIWVDIMQRQ